MKVITHDADAVRQIVPGDMSLLSDADQELAQVLWQLVTTMFDATAVDGSSDLAFALKGCRYSGDALSGAIESGLILYGGRLYQLEAWSGSTILAQGLSLRVAFTTEEVAPSPVYGAEGTRSVSVHKRYVARIVAAGRSEYPVAYSNLRVVPYVAATRTIGEINGQ